MCIFDLFLGDVDVDVGVIDLRLYLEIFVSGFDFFCGVGSIIFYEREIGFRIVVKVESSGGELKFLICFVEKV